MGHAEPIYVVINGITPKDEAFDIRKVIRTKVKRHVLKQHFVVLGTSLHVGNARFKKPNLDRWHRDIL